MRWFTSDQHVGHDNILNLGSGRPFKNLPHMHSVIVNNWFDRIAPEDEVYFLGDVAMGDVEVTLNVFKALPNRKFLIPGNHDKLFPKLNSKSRIERFTPLYENAGFEILDLNHTTDFVVDGETVPVLLSHFPYAEETFNTEREWVDKFAWVRPKNEGMPLIHGHTHMREPLTVGTPNQYNVGVDAHNFMPVSEVQIIEWLKTLN
jgi:calcineurin-like phosphoesterase family protein